MKLSTIGLLVAGVLAAVCAAVLVASFRAGGEGNGRQSGPVEARIVLAAKNLPAMTVVEADCIVEKTVLRGQVPPNSFSDPANVTGKVLSLSMVQGQVFTKACFAKEGAGLHLAVKLPAGMRAVSILLSGDSALETIIYPGSIVDVLASFQLQREGAGRREAVSTVLLQGVQVLAVDDYTLGSPDRPQEGKPAKSRRRSRLVTLKVDIAQAEALQLAKAHGTVSLALRNPRDASHAGEYRTRLSELSAGRLVGLARSVGKQAGGASAEADTSLAAHWETLVIRGSSREIQVFPAASGSD